jgi:hypothetical protein
VSPIGLAALGLAAVFALVVMAAFPNVRTTILNMMTGTVLLVLGLTLVALLVIAILQIDIDPFIRQASVMQTGHRLVDFFTLLPEDHYRVRQVLYENTDDDQEEEWVVFYQFDLADGRNPYGGAVYDSDRGVPPVLFPYRLLPPDRDYLSDSAVRLELQDIVTADEVTVVPELFVYGDLPISPKSGGPLSSDLTIFRHIPNSLPWEYPRDEPRRYRVIGSFRGDGGVTFDPASKIVTVLNRAGYDRSQLAVEAKYALDGARGTYMSVTDPEQLSAPISSQVIFTFGMPPDILDTPYPEKLVVGFYEMLERDEPAVSPRDFLTGQALIEYDQGNLAYFGFENVTGKWADVNELKIMQLSYAPEFEEFDPSVTVLGSDPRFLVVGVAFEATVGQASTRTSAPLQWVTIVVRGKWKIDHRL